MKEAAVTPLVQAKGISEVRLLRRRPRFVVNGIPIETVGIPFALIYATLGVHMLTLVFGGKWWVPTDSDACCNHQAMPCKAGRPTWSLVCCCYRLC